jgi:hypothetical protein
VVKTLGAEIKADAMQFFPFVWKTPVVIGALLVGSFGASQVGWSGAELMVNSSVMEPLENLATTILLAVAVAMTAGPIILVHKIAKAALWVMAPILLYLAIVPGAWNGIAGDFDATRVAVIREHYANAYALEHMGPRGRYRTCEDDRIDLTDDAKEVCARALNAINK